jgi:hypothetical protein
MANIGNSIVSSPYIVDVFSGTGSQTAFTLQYAPATTAAIAVYVAGIYQAPSSYTLSGTTLTFNSAPTAGSSNIQVLHLSIGSVAQVPSDGSVTTAKIATGAVTETTIADGAITAAKIADGAIIAADIAANTVTPAKIAYNAAGTILTTDGASVLWRAQSALAIANTQITGTLLASQGGTGITSLGTGVATWLGTPTAANLATVVTDETGSGNLVFSTAPSLSTPVITNYTETQFAANTGTAITISLANGTLQNLTCNASTTITLPASAAGKSFILIINYAGAFTVAWAGGTTIKWPSGTTPTATSTSGKYDVFSFFQDGVNTYGQTFGLNY